MRIVKTEGLTSLFRGVGANAFWASLMNSSQLASYDIVKASCGFFHGGCYSDDGLFAGSCSQDSRDGFDEQRIYMAHLAALDIF